MKILLLSLNYAPELTGIGKFNGELGEWMSKRGHDVRVIAAPPYYPEWRVHAGFSARRYARQTLGAVKVFRCPLYVPSRVTGLRRLLHLASFGVSSLPLILWQALTWRPDVILVTEPPLAAAPAAILAAALAGGRAVLHVQDYEVDAAFELNLLKSAGLQRAVLAIERWLMRRFSLVTSISPRMVDRLSAKGVLPHRTALVPNWADVGALPSDAEAQAWRRKAGIAEDQLVLLYAGNMGMKQGLETLIEAARHFDRRGDLRFVFCGDGAGRARLEAAATGLANVTFLPLQPLAELAAMLRAADIHLLPQRKGAADLVMPSKLGNMLASGRPVIAGAMEGTQLHAAVSPCGIAVPPEDAPSLVAAIERLSGDAALRRTLGGKARGEALRHWDRQAILESFERMLAPSGVSAADPQTAASVIEQEGWGESGLARGRVPQWKQ